MKRKALYYSMIFLREALVNFIKFRAATMRDSRLFWYIVVRGTNDWANATVRTGCGALDLV